MILCDVCTHHAVVKLKVPDARGRQFFCPAHEHLATVRDASAPTR